MRYAVYDETTLELITVIKLKPEWANFILEHGRMEVRIMRPISVKPMTSSVPIKDDPISVMVWPSRFRNMAGDESFFLWVNDPENALLMKSEILPGQREHLEEAFNNGMRQAFSAMFGR